MNLGQQAILLTTFFIMNSRKKRQCVYTPTNALNVNTKKLESNSQLSRNDLGMHRCLK